MHFATSANHHVHPPPLPSDLLHHQSMHTHNIERIRISAQRPQVGPGYIIRPHIIISRATILYEPLGRITRASPIVTQTPILARVKTLLTGFAILLVDTNLGVAEALGGVGFRVDGRAVGGPLDGLEVSAGFGATEEVFGAEPALVEEVVEEGSIGFGGVADVGEREGGVDFGVVPPFAAHTAGVVCGAVHEVWVGEGAVGGEGERVGVAGHGDDDVALREGLRRDICVEAAGEVLALDLKVGFGSDEATVSGH